MNSHSYFRGYDIEFQKFIGSISCAVVFFNILHLINGNIEGSEKSYRYSKSSHLGKMGVCVTYGEMSNFLCMKKTTVKESMIYLKSQNIIGMDYVILEMIRCPFFFIEESGKRFCEPEPKNMRFFHSHIMKTTECVSDAILHGHIAYWNEQLKNPLTQSMMEISKATGLTYRQIQFSMKKLINLGLIIADTNVDSRYVLTALQTEEGSRKNVGGSLEKSIPPEGIPYSLHRVSVDILDVLDTYVEKEGGREGPPPVFSHGNSDSDEEKKLLTGKTYKVGKFEISMEDYHEMLESHNQDEINWMTSRYNGDREDKKPLNRTPKAEGLYLMSYRRKDALERKEEKEREKQEEEERKSIQREKDAEEVRYSNAQSQARIKASLNSGLKPEGTKPSIEISPVCKVFPMKSIESPEDKEKRIQASS